MKIEVQKKVQFLLWWKMKPTHGQINWKHIDTLYISTFTLYCMEIKSRGPILRVTSSETHSVCVKQALNTHCWLVNVLVTWHVSYKIKTLLTKKELRICLYFSLYFEFDFLENLNNNLTFSKLNMICFCQRLCFALIT